LCIVYLKLELHRSASQIQLYSPI